jgi:hypothetical protein
MMNPWTEEPEEEESNHVNHRELETPPRTSADGASDIHLAYMSSTSDISHRAADRHVRFGAVSDVDQEMDARKRQNEEDSVHDDLATITSREVPDEGPLFCLWIASVELELMLLQRARPL